MNRLLKKVKQSQNLIRLWSNVRHTFREFGVARISYHFSASEAALSSDGFVIQWTNSHATVEISKNDNRPRELIAAGHPVSWLGKGAKTEINDEVSSFIAAMKSADESEGFCIPLFGPRERVGYACFEFCDASSPPVEVVAALSLIANCAHQRICEIIDVHEACITLSAREKEVMNFVGLGKSNSVIGDLLGISPETVATYMKRIYAKLGVSERVGATVKSLKLGLITLE